MKKPKPSSAPRKASWALLLSTGLSGAFLWWAQAGAESWGADHIALALRLHGFSAALALVLLGGILATHLPPGWKDGARRLSGSPLLAVLVLLAGSGWGLYYLVDEAARANAALAHKALGALLPALYAVHGWRQFR